MHQSAGSLESALNQRTRAHFANAIQRLKDERRYRVFIDLDRDATSLPDRGLAAERLPRTARGDHLVLKRLSRHGGHPKVREAAVAAVERHGAGWRHPQHFGHESSSKSSSPIFIERKPRLHPGWLSNLASISTIASLLPNCLILSDALNHNSMIEGVRRSGCEKKIWRHNDVGHLEQMLIEAGRDRLK